MTTRETFACPGLPADENRKFLERIEAATMLTGGKLQMCHCRHPTPAGSLFAKGGKKRRPHRGYCYECTGYRWHGNPSLPFSFIHVERDQRFGEWRKLAFTDICLPAHLARYRGKLVIPITRDGLAICGDLSCSTPSRAAAPMPCKLLTETFHGVWAY